jgi:hypothetical protein
LKITQRNHSRARNIDGGPYWYIDDTPSPNAVNNPTFLSYATTPVLSVAAGFYTATQNVSISSPDPNVTIHYTLNGTAPLITSPTYTVPLVVSVTTAVRAKAFSSVATVLPSLIETNTYLINETSNFATVCLSGAYNAASSIPPSGGLFGSSTATWSSI